MKNFRSIRILLALLLSVCMLFSGIPVFALEDGEEITTDYVTVTLNDEGEADIAVTVAEVEGEDGTGIEAYVSEGYPNVSADGYEGPEGEDLINEEITYELDALDEQHTPDINSISVIADSVKEEYVLLPDNRIPYEEHLEMYVEGINGRSHSGTALNFQVEGDVELSIHNDPERENKGESEDTWCRDSVTAEGIYVDTDHTDVTIATGNVNVNLQYTDTNEEETGIMANLTGVEVKMNTEDAYEHTGAPEGEAAKGDVSVGNVTLTAEADTAEPELNLTGIDVTAGPGASMVLEAGDVTIKGTASGEAVSEEKLARIGDGESTIGASATGVNTSQNVDATVGKIEIDLNVTGENLIAKGTGIFAGGEGNTVQADSVNMTAASEGTSSLKGIYAESEAEVIVENNVELSAEGKDAYAFGVEAVRSASVETGDVKAEAKAEEGEARAIAVSVQDSCFEADGDVEAISNGVTTANSYGVQISGDSKAMIHGDVTADAASTDEENGSYAVGVYAQGLINTVTTTEIDGDVTAAGDSGAGIVVEYGELSSYEGEKDEEEEGNDAPTVNVLVSGTVSGPSTAIEVMEDDNLSVEDVNLTLWAAEENEEGQIAAVYSDEAGDGNYTLNEEATTALEKAINYIVKFAAGLTFDAISTQKGNTVEFLDEKYHTANEDELVSVKASDTDEKELMGIFYNAEDESTLQEVKDLNKDENGNYQIQMKRGGGMQLGLQWHTHIYDTREKDRVEPTCTEDGSVIVETYCTQCGKVAVTETKVLPKGHTPGEAKKENETAATCKAEGSYDMVVRCSVCNEIISSEHFVTEKLAHTPGEAVRENEVPATERTNGSYDEVIYCTACGAEISRETKVIPKLQDKDSGNKNQNGSQKTTADLLEVVIVVADEQSDAVLSLVDDAGKAGNILSFLPDEIKDEIPADFSTVKTRNAMKIVGDIEEAVSFDAVFEFETPFTAGDTVYLLIAFTGVDGQTTWYLLKGEANKDGNVVANLTSLLSILGNQQFVVLTVTK